MYPNEEKIVRFRNLLLGLVCTSGIFHMRPAATAQTLPPDAQPTAAVPPENFASWFASGKPTLNGLVKPANSVTLAHSSNIDFYHWSEQMFLWVTSPTGEGHTARVMSSPTFFLVMEADSTDAGKRKLKRQNIGEVQRFATRTAQAGPHGFPVIFNKAGKMFEILPQTKEEIEKKLVLNAEGKSVSFEKLVLNDQRKAIFLDAGGKEIVKARPSFPDKLKGGRFVKLHKTNTDSLFIDDSGEVLDVGVGQAGGGGVLLAQNGSVVYYNTLFNDVMAYFRTLNSNTTSPASQFPTTQAELDQIVAFAKTQDAVLPDANALTVEVKASWVEAASLKNIEEYITIDAFVPTFNKSNPKNWVEIPNGEKKTKLAMVGLHFVGSTNGHPEMVWSTFEHIGNTPVGTYQYNAITGANPKTVSQNTQGNWLFCKSNAQGSFNTLLQNVSNTNPLTITAVTGQTAIAPNDASLVNAFGAAFGVNPNADATYAESNTQMISLNNSVRSQLVKGDVRANYFFVGSTWTEGGQAPTGAYPQGNVIGTSQLANSTMETFQQQTGNNCFSCHRTNTTNVSHVYPIVLPLPLKKH